MNGPALDLNVWQTRWQGMSDSIEHWLAAADAGQQQFERQDTLLSLLASLQAFGKSQMDFFLQGLAEDPSYRLEPSARYPWEYVFRTTVDQIGFDMDVLLRAAQQRMSSLMSKKLLATLDLADRLGYLALQPAFDHGLIDRRTAVVTYFQKAVNVRLTPYAPVTLIGIPFSAVDSPRDLLAIPHEVGHFVFREGRIRSGRFADSRFSAALYSRFAYQPAWFSDWLEEIFADVYGCLVAGPAIALSFIELVTDDPVDDFVKQDHEHPAPAVRPQGYFSTLQRMGMYDNALQRIEDHWQELFDERGAPDELHLPDEEEPFSIHEILEDIDGKVVEMLLQEQFLGGLLPEQDDATHSLWSKELQPDEPLEALYASYKEFIDTVTPQSTPIPGLRRRPNGQMQLVMPGRGGNGPSADGPVQRLGATGLLIDAIKASAKTAAGQGDPVFAVPPDIWAVILDAGGWATEGPGGGNLHS